MAQKVDIKKLKENEENPRYINKEKFQKLVDSIKEFPEMLEQRPIIVDEDYFVLGGNMRLKACQKAGLKKVWISQVNGWTNEQKREFIIKDNIGFGEWDWDMINNQWAAEQLKGWGMDIFFEEEVDYSILEDADIDKAIDEMNEGTRKAIILEYEVSKFEKVKKIYDKLKKSNIDIPEIFYQAIKKWNTK